MDTKQFKDLPDTPGVYYFLGSPKRGEGGLGSKLKAKSKQLTAILYIGKATSLRDRVKSYFTKDLLLTRGPLIEKMIGEVREVKFVRTDSVLEAMMLEVAEIKKHQPFYNSREKDDKSYNYVVITKEDFPRVLTIRGRELKETSNKKQDTNKFKISKTFGPFPNSSELKTALKIIRKIFPFRDKCTPWEKIKNQKSNLKITDKNLKLLTPRPCFNSQIGLCPGVCTGEISKAEYKKTILHLKMFFEGNKSKLVETLEKEMNTLAKKQKFEEAEKVKHTLYALEHIQDIAMIKADMSRPSTSLGTTRSMRVEAYDIAHFGGKETVGVMTVVVDGELDKSQYRKFKIRGTGGKRSDLKNSRRSDLKEPVGIDDTGNLKEVLTRRLGHLEWPLPNLIVVDGGVAQINSAKEVLKERGFNIDLVSVVKDEKHKARQILKGQTLSTDSQGLTLGNLEKEILLANAEAHRFAIKYHRRLRNKGFRI